MAHRAPLDLWLPVHRHRQSPLSRRGATRAHRLADIYIAWADVWEETESRRELGGLPRGEYFMHIVLSVLVGLYLATVAHAVWPDRLLPAAVVLDPPAVPFALRLYMTLMAVGAFGVFVLDSLRWFRFRREAAAMATS